MADFNISDVASKIEPPKGMTLGEMLNMARGVQAYQQAGQINPLTLRQQQAETAYAEEAKPELLKKLKAETNVAVGTEQPRIEAQKFATETAGVGTQSAQLDFANKQSTAVANRLTPLINHPLIIASEQNPDKVDKNQLSEVMKKYGEEQAKALGIPKERADQLIQPYLDQAINNTSNTRQFLKEKLLSTLDQGARATAIGSLGVSTTPSAPEATGKQQMETKMKLPYPVRSSAQSYNPEPTEPIDQKSGAEYRTNLINSQMGLSQAKRNTQEVIDQANKINNELYFAKGGIPGQIEQKIRMAIGSEQYDLLAKDLANMAITNVKALGSVGSTVAGLDMQAVANGTIKVPPDVLIKIARRVQSDQTNIDMQANGAQEFARKFGDNNMKAFQQEWNKNGESKIFEGINIVKDIEDPKQRKEELNKLFPNPKQNKEFLEKYRNLKKLSETGSL
jgi:hypothetical protein